MTQYRTLERVVDARASADGDGVKINRIAGGEMMRQLDPFLLLDEIRSDESADYIGGFPPHPHRGFETVTYMLEGAMRHRDHLGNEGVIASGDVQWMTAGSGVIHSEMPEQTEGLLHGFQLWLNLPAKEKMQSAAYQEYSRTRIPVVELPGVGTVRVIAGEVYSAEGPVIGPVADRSTHPTYLDVELDPGADWSLPVDPGHTVLVRVFGGATTELTSGQLGVYRGGDALALSAGEQGARALVLAGSPIGEPISQYGPFVMNTSEEIEQAITDYNEGRLTA